MTKFESLPKQPAAPGSMNVGDTSTPSNQGDESLTSSLINSIPSHVDSAADVENSGAPRKQAPSPAGGFLVKIRNWIKKRNKRKVKYPAPFDRCFEQLDLWKLFAVLGAMVTAMATFRTYELISKEIMRNLILKLGLSFLFLTVTYTLQDMVPEIAVGTMLTGIALAIASFHTVGLHLLDLPEEQIYLAISVLFVAYAIPLSLILHKLVKDDVREKEETDQETQAHDIAMV